MNEVVIGSRGSALAVAQTNWVADRIREHNRGAETRVEIIKTRGDKILDSPLANIGDKGLFVKEIEIALAEGRIDVAVHSMKDLPSETTPGLVIGAVPPRVDPSDVLLSTRGSLAELPPGSRIGSSSLRRKAQILNVRPDLEFRDIRGNLDTRIRKLESGQYDAIVVAYAGLHRLELGGWRLEVGDGRSGIGPLTSNLKLLTSKLPFDVCLPAVGQGALAVQIREDDERTAEIVSPLDDWPSRAAVTAERALLAALGGGCQTPIAAVATPDGDDLVLLAMVASLDGREVIRVRESGQVADAEFLGERAAARLLDSGAREMAIEN